MATQYDPILAKLLRRISTTLIEQIAQAAADTAAQEAAQEAAEAFAPQVESVVTAAVEEALDTVNAAISALWRQLHFRTTNGAVLFDTLDCGDAFPEEPYPLDWDFGEWGDSGPALQFKLWTVQP